MRYICPRHRKELTVDARAKALIGTCGCSYPIVDDIPRFVPAESYAAAFGAQWNAYRLTQLDSHTGRPVSRQRLQRLLGGSFDICRGKTVLEAGCGAGRFTEILLQEGATVTAVDLSSAVEANRANCSRFRDYSAVQANILELPFEPEQFDLVLCVGVVQHTPCPEDTIRQLAEQVKPGGLLVLDHYTYDYRMSWSRKLLRCHLLKRSPSYSLHFCRTLTDVLWPIHRFFWGIRRLSLLRRAWLRISPLVDYHESYSELGLELLKAWAALDTHDNVTDVYKHLRSAEEIQRTLDSCGMYQIDTAYAGNGVEARAHKPLTAAAR